MKKQILFLSLFIIFASTATASNHEVIEGFNETANLTQIQESINDNQDEIPGFIETIVGGQSINLYFENTSYSYGAELDGTKVETLQYQELEDPTLEVTVEPETLESILTTNQSVFQEIQDALDEGGIEYEAKTAKNSIVFTITDTLMDIASILGIFG
jgi:hypothetical protein